MGPTERSSRYKIELTAEAKRDHFLLSTKCHRSRHRLSSTRRGKRKDGAAFMRRRQDEDGAASDGLGCSSSTRPFSTNDADSRDRTVPIAGIHMSSRCNLLLPCAVREPRNRTAPIAGIHRSSRCNPLLPCAVRESRIPRARDAQCAHRFQCAQRVQRAPRGPRTRQWTAFGG